MDRCRLKLLKQWLAGLLVASLCFAGTSCRERKKEASRFGMDVNDLNPLVMTATDCASGETVFSRDPSVISEVLALFQNMKPSPSKTTDQQGISFTVSTMYGDFAFGECTGKTLRMNGVEYVLEKDYSTKIQLLYERMQSETESMASVSADTLARVTPDMTCRELLDLFGPTLVTAAVGKNEAYLYQYGGRPFYILFEKDTDAVGMTGEQLKREILSDYNLGQSLAAPAAFEGGRLAVYEQAFDAVMDKLSTDSFTGILLDTKKLVYLDDTERQEFVDYLGQKYGMAVTDDSSAAEFALDGTVSPPSGFLVFWIEQYTYIGENKMDFTAAAKLAGQETVTRQMESNLKDNEWSVQTNG